MTTYVYPRLTEAHALARLVLVREAAEVSFEGIREIVAVEHDQASPVPTGGSLASPSVVRALRDSVMDQVGDLVDEDGNIGVPLPVYDWRLGRSLYEHLHIVHSDAAHSATWNFLSLMVFPDLVWARFPDPSEDRALGGPRNVLRRTWRRFELLRDLDGRGAETLNEDELVQLTERTALARNQRLVNELARRVIEYQGPRRMLFTRELCKRATFSTGPLLLDFLEPRDLAELVDALARGVPWTPREGMDTMASNGHRSDFADVASFVNAMAPQSKLERLLCLMLWETQGGEGQVPLSRLDELNREAGGDVFSDAGSMAQRAAVKALMVRPRPGRWALTPAGRQVAESLPSRSRSQV